MRPDRSLLTKRELLQIGLAASVIPVSADHAFGQESAGDKGRVPDLIKDWGFISQEDALVEAKDSGAVGSEKSDHKHVVNAFRLLFNAPRDKTPYEVAQYFYGLKDTAEGRPYVTEWANSSQANPLVVGFFTSTRTIPSGDVTPWCAAFVNFCFMASGLRGTGSPLSGTFRAVNHKEFFPVDNPRKGDIAVFWANGDRGDEGFGHVAFVDGMKGGKEQYLGGNQTNKISVQDFTVPGKTYKKMEYRRVKV